MKDRKIGVLVAGFGAWVLGLVGTLIYGEPLDFVAEPEEIAAFYMENSSDVITANALYLLAGVFLFTFVGYLYAALRRHEPGEGRISLTVLAAGAVGVGFMFLSAATDLVAGLRVDERDVIDPAVATAIWDISSIAFGIGAPVALSLLTLGTAKQAFDTGVLPKWHGGISVVLGIWMLILPISFAAILAFLILWVPLTAVVLYLGKEGAPVPTAAPPGARTAA